MVLRLGCCLLGRVERPLSTTRTRRPRFGRLMTATTKLVISMVGFDC